VRNQLRILACNPFDDRTEPADGRTVTHNQFMEIISALWGMTKAEWKKISDKRVGKNTLTHTDGAPAYSKPRPGTMHDKVSHGRNGGKKPQYTKLHQHPLPDGTVLEAQGGTQSLDGWWKHGKRACDGTQARNPTNVEEHVRAEQWRHWIGDADRWVEAGKVISWIPEP
jgi:hypothetical protein